MSSLQEKLLWFACVAGAVSLIWLGVLTAIVTGPSFDMGGNITKSKIQWKVSGDNLTPKSSDWSVGIASSTPFGQLGIGAGGNTSSTISAGKLCIYAGQEDGTPVYVYLATNLASGSPFVTSSVSCF